MKDLNLSFFDLKKYTYYLDYYDKIWYSKNEDEIKKNQYMIMLDLDKKKLENMPLEDISKGTDLSIEEINEISNES